MIKKNLFAIAALAAMGILLASRPTGGDGGGGVYAAGSYIIVSGYTRVVQKLQFLNNNR
jgi:hypothetical protein